MDWSEIVDLRLAVYEAGLEDQYPNLEILKATANQALFDQLKAADAKAQSDPASKYQTEIAGLKSKDDAKDFIKNLDVSSVTTMANVRQVLTQLKELYK